MEDVKTTTAYVIQDCVERGSGDDYHFDCDAQVRLSREGAKTVAWERFAGHYERLTGHPPSDEIKAEFEDVMSDPDPCYTIDATEEATVTVEILEREAV